MDRQRASESATECLTLRLYVAGDAPNSLEARANLGAMLKSHPGRYELEIVDFLTHPLRALEDGVIITPTLVRLAPRPVKRVIGTLREVPAVLSVLGITKVPNG